jgi:hypothetical protein
MPFRELVGQLLEFHRRENKSAYWAMFHRQELPEEELIECTISSVGDHPVSSVEDHLIS